MKFFLTCLCTVGALVYCAIDVVEAQHRAVALAFDIAQATDNQTRLADELRQLRIDRAALLDPTRLEPIAQDHGLRVPAPDQVVVLGPARGAK